MTLLGKIFTLMIFLMSIMFMALSTMVFATHKNWKMVAINPTPNEKFDLGLKQQVETARATNKQLRIDLEIAKTELAKEKAARRQALAALQSELAQAKEQLSQKEQELATLTAAHGVALQAVKVAEDTVTNLRGEVEALRVAVRTAQQERDGHFAMVVKLTDQLNQAKGVEARLQERYDQLAFEMTKMKKVMDAYGLTKDSPTDNRPPPLDGIILAVTEKFVEVSLGSDDGIRNGHEMDVSRDNSYLGKIIIRKTAPDRAVGQILDEYRRGPIRKGDRVSTKLS